MKSEFKKTISLKEFRLKNYKLKQKLSKSIIETEETFPLVDIDETKAKSDLIQLIKSIKSKETMFIESEEDISKIAQLLYNIPSLKKFYKEYSINERSLKEMLNFCEIIESKKGTCLFLQDELPSEMFLLIEGELILKYSKKIIQEPTLNSYIINEFNLDFLHNQKILKNDLMDELIENKNFRKPGMKESTKDLDYMTQKMILSTPRKTNFKFYKENEEIEYMKINGERFISQNNLLTFTPHSINCYVNSNDSIILSLDRKSFHISLHKNINKVDDEYKKFICSRINVFSKFNNETLNVYFYSLIKIYPELNEKIYSVGEEAKYFYLLFDGLCLNIVNNRKINIFSKGSFIGLDSLFNPKKKYLNTVICKDNNTILFRFCISSFNDKIINSLKKQLAQFYYIKKDVSKKFLLKEENFFNKFRFKNLNKIKYENEHFFTEDSNPFDEAIKSKISAQKKEIQSYNELPQKNLFFSTKNFTINTLNKNTSRNLIKLKLKKNNNNSGNYLLTKNRTVLKKDNKILNSNSYSSVKKNKSINKSKNVKKLSESYFHKPKIKKIFLGKNRNLNKNFSYSSSAKLTDESEINIIYSSYRDSINLRKNYEDSKLYNDVNMISLTDRGSTPVFFHNKSNEYRKTLNEKVELSIDKWVKTLKDKKKSFKTKHYNLPLVTSMKYLSDCKKNNNNNNNNNCSGDDNNINNNNNNKNSNNNINININNK